LHIRSFIRLNKDFADNPANTRKLTFARMIIMPVHATGCNLLYLNRNAKNVDFVIIRYAVRKAKIRPYAVPRLKMKQ